MTPKDPRLRFLRTFIQSKKIVLIDQLLEQKQLNCCERTVRKEIKKIEGITSYTHRGKYLTLSEMAKFDRNGICFYQGVGFSKHGNSLKTIVALISQNQDGLSREKLEEILKIKISKQIQILLQQDRLHRVKIGNKYQYLPEALAKNKKKRLRALNINSIEEYYDARVSSSNLIALLKAVLVEKKIKIDVKSLERFAQKYCLKIPLKKIEQLLLKYNLTEKKSHRIDE